MGIISQLINLFSSGPAIQNLENFDMLIQMKDGGLLLPIVCSKHLDESAESIQLLRSKINNYIHLMNQDSFKNEHESIQYVLIELNCIQEPTQNIKDELVAFEKKFIDRKIKFAWKI